MIPNQKNQVNVWNLWKNCLTMGKRNTYEDSTTFLWYISCGSIVFPLVAILWLPKNHNKYLSKNDVARDFINNLNKIVKEKEKSLTDVEITFDIT
jgi:hypothetical protein